MRWVVWAVVAAASLGGWLALATDGGDSWGRWSDHRRHTGEAIALQHHGLALYTQTYNEATRGLQLPCEMHEGLWGDTGVPYPPLGVALHWPFALLERHGVWAPPLAHKLLVWLFGFVGLVTAWLGARLLQGWRRWLFVALFGPLLVGVGFSGFYDVLFALAAVLAVTHGRRWAVVAWLLHFRGVVVLSLYDWRRAWGPLALIALNAVVAVVASLHLGVFTVTSRLHYSMPQSWWFPPATAALWWLVRKEGFGWPVLVTAVVMFTDRQRMFWHMLAWLPLVLGALRRGSSRTALGITAWAVVGAQAALDTVIPFNVLWLWLRAV